MTGNNFIDDEDYEDDYKEVFPKFITKEDARHVGFSQQFACPNCGSYNTGQSTYADYCLSCDWGNSY